MIALSVLLARSAISRWDERTWFQGVRLQGTTLWVPDAEQAGWIRRHWMPRMQQHLPELEIKVLRETDTPKEPVWVGRVLNTKGRKAYRGQVETQERLLD